MTLSVRCTFAAMRHHCMCECTSVCVSVCDWMYIWCQLFFARKKKNRRQSRKRKFVCVASFITVGSTISCILPMSVCLCFHFTALQCVGIWCCYQGNHIRIQLRAICVSLFAVEIPIQFSVCLCAAAAENQNKNIECIPANTHACNTIHQSNILTIFSTFLARSMRCTYVWCAHTTKKRQCSHCHVSTKAKRISSFCLLIQLWNITTNIQFYP